MICPKCGGDCDEKKWCKPCHRFAVRPMTGLSDIRMELMDRHVREKFSRAHREVFAYDQADCML